MSTLTQKGDPMKPLSFSSITVKTILVHTVTYFIVGFLSFTFLDYSAKYADEVVSNLMRQTNDPLVAAGPIFQVLRGFLFGIVFYLLRDWIFPKKHGWLYLWLILVIVGILSPFGAMPSSIEGILYTVLPIWYHITALPELLIQSGALAFFTVYWVNHPEKKWMGWAFGILFVLVIVMSLLGALLALGVLPSAG
jgi:hypothetical protein